MKLFDLDRFVKDMNENDIEVEGFICRRYDKPGWFDITIPHSSKHSIDWLYEPANSKYSKLLAKYWVDTEEI